MTRSQQRLLSQLATSPNELASGLGQCLEALRLISELPRASPVFVHYTSVVSPTIKAFGREHLSRVPLRTVLTLIKTSLDLSDPIHITSALFYREDGSIDPTPVHIDEDSWKELVPYVHTLHVDDDLPHPSIALSAFSVVPGGINGARSVSPVPMGAALSRGPGGLNSNASTFVPSSAQLTVKTNDGTRLHLQDLRRLTPSPSSPQASSPFAMLENADSCI